MKFGRILILGASSDIGMELLREIDGRVSVIYAHGHQNTERLLAYSRNSKSKIVTLQADLANDTQVGALADKLESGQLPQAMVHLAAPRLEMTRLKDLKTSNFKNELDAQVLGPSALILRLCPLMIKEGPSRLIFLLSNVTLGKTPSGLAPYVVAKFALLGLMRALDAEYAQHDMLVSGLSPGMVDTAFIKNIHKTIIEKTARSSNNGRLATAADVAKKLVWMLETDTENLAGKNLSLDA